MSRRKPKEIFLVSTDYGISGHYLSREGVKNFLELHPSAKVQRAELQFEDFDSSDLKKESGPYVYRFTVIQGPYDYAKGAYAKTGVYETVSYVGGEQIGYTFAQSVKRELQLSHLFVRNIRRTKAKPWTDELYTIREVKPLQ